MNTSPPKRTAKTRLESLGFPRGPLGGLAPAVFRRQTWIHLAMLAVAALLLLVICRTWEPPFAYRHGDVPARDLVSRIDFQVVDATATEVLRVQKRRETLAYYVNRKQPLLQLREELKDLLFLVSGAESFSQMTADQRRAFNELLAADDDWLADQPGDVSAQRRFETLAMLLDADGDLKQIDGAVELALLPAAEHGLLQSLKHSAEQGDLRVIRVYPPGDPREAEVVEVSQVRIAQARAELRQRLKEQFRQRFEIDQAGPVAEMISRWLEARLPETLRYDDELSTRARQEAAEQVQNVMKTYRRGVSLLASAGQRLGPTEIELLRREWETMVSQMGHSARLARMLAYLGMIAALGLLGGAYIHFVDDHSLIDDTGRLGRLLCVIVITVAICQWVSRDQWRAELIPLSIAAMIGSIVYGRALALVLMASTALAVTLFIGGQIGTFVTLGAASLSCVLLLGRVRSRTHLLSVGIAAALVTAMTVIGVGMVTGDLLTSGEGDSDVVRVLPTTALPALLTVLSKDAIWSGLSVIIGSLAMTGLLPLVERAFGVQTDLSLLELGDASHPLLRRLAQRAPGTYNHSINVASLAEAAADEIGANGLLVRVGAYFHDIGKMFKPDYFVENQSNGINQHDSLQPAMSTLVIIAHVKDGADLARSHHLPRPIIDFILQHHGTTLVEYFFREAAKRSECDPNREEVNDKDFRYPGPKPQTLEAAVLMLADSVESASRTLVEPTAARIAHLVEGIATKRLTDGQFDQCGLTFQQLSLVKKSLVKSLTAIYHARVKYPGQQSA